MRGLWRKASLLTLTTNHEPPPRLMSEGYGRGKGAHTNMRDKITNQDITAFLAETFHIHDASVPRWLEWLQVLFCEVCRYQSKYMHVTFVDQCR
jgi:hypothetical protein